MTEKEYYQELGKRLVEIRDKNKLTQREVAKEMGITFQQYQKYESGVNRIPTKALVAFCNLTKYNISKITGCSVKDYDTMYKENVVQHYNTHNNTTVNHYYGIFSNIFDMDLKMIRNKIALSMLILAIVFHFVCYGLKFIPNFNFNYNSALLSLQFLLFNISLFFILLAAYSCNILTLLVAFINYLGIYATLYRFWVAPILTEHQRCIMTLVAFIATILTYILLKAFGCCKNKDTVITTNRIVTENKSEDDKIAKTDSDNINS